MQTMRPRMAPKASNHKGAGGKSMQPMSPRMTPKASNHRGGRREADAANEPENAPKASNHRGAGGSLQAQGPQPQRGRRRQAANYIPYPGGEKTGPETYVPGPRSRTPPSRVGYGIPPFPPQGGEGLHPSRGRPMQPMTPRMPPGGSEQ